jgi:ergothioneine biosynthesis protein EgtB
MTAHPQFGRSLGAERERFWVRLRAVRAVSEAMCQPLEIEDYVVQSMPDVSPPKWHLAHVSWFFETFALSPRLPGYVSFDDRFQYLFNSYYEAAGPRHPRHRRGVLTRPTVREVYAYRAHVDRGLEKLIVEASDVTWRDVSPVLELGVHHEQQHQELLLTDIKHILGANPLRPSYRAAQGAPCAAAVRLEWTELPEGLYEIGHDGAGFAFDNEGPRHRVWTSGFRLASRLTTNGEYADFIAADGYRRPEFWMSDGWATVQREGWTAPLYWERDGDDWSLFTLEGMKPLDPAEPVCHVSFYEADAFARWSKKRLPTEAEWEIVACRRPITGNFYESSALHPRAATQDATEPSESPRQMYGDVWEWTASPYVGYPGFAPAAGALGEYNGKFMCNQMILRGGSCVTSATHIRPTYRNFFPPDARWQFTGVRLAEDA